MIDVSCFAGPGPLTSLSPVDLEPLLRREGVTRAAVSPMPALFGDFTMSLPRSDFFTPVPIVDPNAALPSAGPVRACTARDALRARRAGLVVVLQLRVADLRNVPAELGLVEVAVEDAVAVARAEPSLPMVVAGVRVPELNAILAATPDSVHAELSMAEQPDVVRRAVETHGAQRLLMGTHAPFLTPAAARLKLAAARLGPAEHAALTAGNALALGF